jgi:hypothetical protein
MAKSNPKPKKERGSGRYAESPHTGETKSMVGTKAGKSRVMRHPSDPDRTHDGPKWRSNKKRFDDKKRKLGILDPATQEKKTGTKENPYN